ncbi:charged multivesicular body protein 6 isoform X1 [Elephas maximus indicus]|uniref:charged multivesicular body protein 6 isoform X1 n=1 Tax=Elephas maximus indicus TaxID=99487 RepID=UPI002116461D|nr:charged multivesicular body protein 6 isoform X1 [Elephas maximus indicus]
MGNLFSRKKQSRVTEQDKAILQLKQQRDKLRQYQKRITQQLERERAIARQLLRDGKKERAKLLLKKKRYREQLLDKTENQITSLERMVQSIEFTQIEMKVMEGLQFGNECLRKMHQVMSIEEVERILDETQEAVEYQRQIDELLAGSLTQEDEDAVLEELDAITQEQVELPEVPAEPLPDKIPGTVLALSSEVWELTGNSEQKGTFLAAWGRPAPPSQPGSKWLVRRETDAVPLELGLGPWGLWDL